MRFSIYFLKKRKNIVNTLKKGKTIENDFFKTIFLKSDKFKFTVFCPKKVSKKAVKRNRIKRIVREAIKDIIKSGKIPSINIVIISKKDISEKKSYEVRFLLEEIFKRICSYLMETRE